MNQPLKPLSGQGKEITYQAVPGGRLVHWGETSFNMSDDLVVKIMDELFKDYGWYPLGASMTDPTPGGLGEFIDLEPRLTPRHASAIAAIMVDDGLLEYRGTKPIELRKVKQETYPSVD